MSTHVAPSRWLAHPVLSLLLALSWLALSNSLALVHLLAAALIGVVVPRLIHAFLPQAGTLRWAPAIRLTGVVLWDIVVSNITVARLVLGPIDGMQPLWLKVPLASRHPRMNALFASIITTTPGTVSCVVDEEHSCIWVHAIHGTDGPAMVTDMKQRYEQPLLHILGVQPEERQP